MQLAAMEDHVRRAEFLGDRLAQRRFGQRAAIVPAALVKERRPVRHLGAFLAKAEPDQKARRVRPDVDAGADFGEQARLLIDLHVEAGLQQADRGGEPADAAADDRDLDILKIKIFFMFLALAIHVCDALAAHLIVARDRGRPVAGGERRERRLHPRQRRIAMDVREQRLHAGDQRLAVEQLADGDGRIEGGLVALGPGQLAEIGVEVGGRRDAAGEGAAARIEQHGLGGGKHVEALRDRRGVAGVVHVAGRILQSTMRAPNVSSRRFTSATCQCRPDCCG